MPHSPGRRAPGYYCDTRITTFTMLNIFLSMHLYSVDTPRRDAAVTLYWGMPSAAVQGLPVRQSLGDLRFLEYRLW